MRNCATIVFVAVLLFLVGCAHHHAQSNFGAGRSILSGRESIAVLNAAANDSSNNQAERARAIFTLFAYHLRPGCSAAEVHSVLTDTRWLQGCRCFTFEGVGAGWIPIDVREDRTVFDLHLFSTEKDDAGNNWWCIEFSLSGPNRSATDAVAFLKGNATMSDNPKLEEFALFFPPPTPPKIAHGHSPAGRRVEVYSEKGVYVYPE